MLLLSSCSSGYKITGFERSHILIDSTYDATADKTAADFMKPYKSHVDSIMSPVVGVSAEYMSAERPESKLSNLLADILVWSGKDYGEHPDFAVYNIGGIRSAIAKGKVTYGEVLDVAPFENKICFVTLTGAKVTELFEEMAMAGGEGVSHGVELVIPDAKYRIATLDFVAQGNDNMTAFKSSTDINSPSSKSNNVRFIIMKYMKEKMNEGVKVSSVIEGRIKTE